jgi:TonB family protein
MGKIVKYCAACEESFAEKFAFCPNCGQAMTAFEMNPVVKETPVTEEAAAPPTIVEDSVIPAYAPVAFDAAPVIETAPVAETTPVSADQTHTFSEDLIEDKELIKEDVEEIEPEYAPTATKTFAAAAGANGNGSINGNNYQTANFNHQSASNSSAVETDEGFRVTMVEEKNGKQRNLLLLGSMALMITLVLGGTVYSIFNKDLGVGAIDDAGLFAGIVVEDVPVEVEEQPKPKNKEEGGGGGGGGKEEPEPASKGRLVSQSEKPITPPDAKLPQLTNPDIKIIQETKGNIKRPITAERAGLPGSDNLNPSNGRGSGGGIGSGSGTGIGSGNGTGEGSGNGSGSGGGNGNGNGDGRGDGTGQRTPPPPPPTKPPVVEVVSEPFKIISKPRATYTDAARQNQVTGVVRLRVTFSASGSIGSIAPVSGLPYGLTEQAIAAARQIRFEPAKKNGVPVASTKIIEYSFTIY